MQEDVQSIKSLQNKFESLEQKLDLLEKHLEAIRIEKCLGRKLENGDMDVESFKPAETPLEQHSLHKRLLYLLSRWMQNTTWNGPGTIHRSKKWPQKIFWILIFLILLAATVYACTATIQTYFQYGETTSIQIRFDLPAEFPTVTICNLNPFFLDILTPKNFVDQINNYSSYSNGDINLNNSLESVRFQKHVAHIKYKEFPALYQLGKQLGDSSLIDSFKSRVLSCDYVGSPCEFHSDFQVFPLMDYLFCFKFNSNVSSIKKIGKNGRLNGFQFSFFLGDANIFSKSRGLRLFIHNSTHKFPFSITDVQPGKMANIGLRRTFYNRLGMPYSNCISDLTPNSSDQTEMMKYMFNVLNIKTYTYVLCESILLQHFEQDL
jgi:hypothetical protein